MVDTITLFVTITLTPPSPGAVDSSGLEFTLTPQLRKQDASMLIVGHDISQLMMVPPGQEAHTVAGHCSDECLQMVSGHTSSR